MSVIGPVQSHYHEGSPVGKRSLRWEGFVEKVGFEPGVKQWRSDGWWKRGWWERWVDKWMRRWMETRLVRLSGWRSESGSWFQRRGHAYLNERSVIFKEETVGRWERVTTDEERVVVVHVTIRLGIGLCRSGLLLNNIQRTNNSMNINLRRKFRHQMPSSWQYPAVEIDRWCVGTTTAMTVYWLGVAKQGNGAPESLLNLSNYRLEPNYQA